MATITLKNQKEPLITQYEVAQKVRALWFDEDIPSSHKIAIGDVAVIKSEIKQINLSAMGVTFKREDHWIIRSEKRNSIWQGTFPSYESAKEEYDKQMEMLHPEVRSELDWVIEKRSAGGTEEKTPEARPVKTKDEINWGGL